MYRNKTSRQHNFAIVPGTQKPRSVFPLRQTRKQAFDASDLIPIMCEEVLPGDSWSHRESMVARFATPIAPVVDDLDIETFYFFVPNRILVSTEPGGSVTANQNTWEDFITGQQDITIPLLRPTEGPSGHWIIPVGSVWDHYGIPSGDYTAPIEVTALPFYAYFLIYNEWFRDQNLQIPWVFDGAYSQTQNSDDIEQDTVGWDLMPLRANKRHDYFTSSLPFAQKGNPILLPLGDTAPVIPLTDQTFPTFGRFDGTGSDTTLVSDPANNGNTIWSPNPGALQTMVWRDPGLQVDLSAATSATINAIRLASVSQQMLELDARGGSRYVENLLAHWGVRSPDYRLNRPEYLGGSKIPVTVNPVAQTAAYDAQPDDDPSAVGNLGAEMHASQGNKHTFNYSATEHGYIIGLACARATPTYQQGFRRHWVGRHTRFDYYDPLFANLGEQAVSTIEIYMPSDTSPTNETWGYQEQAAEYRYTPNEITGVLRSTAAQPLDWWHYAEEFGDEPALNAEFITDKTKETLARSLATAPSAQWSAQIIMDINHDSRVARLMPAYSVPGISRF